MSYFYNTQSAFNQTGNLNCKSLDFTKNNFSNTFNGTFKNQQTNFTTFQNFNKTNTLKSQNIYNVIKLQYSLVLDFLSKTSMTFTINSLNNEIKSILYPTTPFTDEEISKLIDTNSVSEFQDTFDKNPVVNSIKSTFLYHLIYTNSNLLKAEKEVQTLDENNKVENNSNIKVNNYFSPKSTKLNGSIFMHDIDEKLKQIDDKYNQKLKNNNMVVQDKSLENKFSRYKKELEDKYKEELKNEIQRIKTIEVSNVLIEENKKYLEKIEAIRNEYENNYEIKNNDLMKREKKLKDKQNKLEDKYEEEKKELIEKYQKKLNDFHAKESNFNTKVIKELKEIKEKKTSLDLKEKELFRLKKDYYKEMQKEIDIIKEELKKVAKEQLEKMKYENELELEKEKNKFKFYRINYDLNEAQKLGNEHSKEIESIKNEIKEIKNKINKDNKKRKKIEPSNNIDDLQKKCDYYEQINNLELKINEIINKTRLKFYNTNKNEEEKNSSTSIIKDENIRKKMDELENEQNELNKEFEKELNNKEEIPKLNKQDIDNIQDYKYNLILSNIEREKVINDFYKRESEEKNVLDKIKYIEEIEKNLRENLEADKKEGFIVIDKNEMDRHQNLYLKVYRQKREQQKIDEINKQKERIRQRELKEKEIIEREKEEKRKKSKEKEDFERSLVSKSIQLPPVRNPRKTSFIGEIEELINKSKIRIAKPSLFDSPEKSKIKKEEDKKEDDKIKSSGGDEDDYGSGDFENLSEEKKSKLNETKKENEKIKEEKDASLMIDEILNGNNTENITENNANSGSYNDFETSNALEKKGIKSENSEADNDKSKHSINSSEDYRF